MEAFVFGIYREISLLVFAEGMNGQLLTAWTLSTARAYPTWRRCFHKTRLQQTVHVYLYTGVSHLAYVPPRLPWVQSLLYAAGRLKGSSQVAHESISLYSFGSPHCSLGKISAP